MAVNLSFIGGAGWQFFDDNGVPLSGGKIFTYVAGTTTPLATYTTRDGLTPNTNPIILDAAGRTPQEIWSTEGLLYKYVVKTSDDTLIRTWDNIGGSVVASDLAQSLANTTNNAKGDALVGFRQSNSSGFLLGAVARTVNDKLQETVSVLDFGAVGDGVADDTLAIQTALNSTETRRIYFPAGRYRITSSLVLNQNAILEGCGSNDELNNFGFNNITTIEVDGDFDGLTVNPAAPSYYGYITIKNIKVVKVSGSATLNRGIYSQFFTPGLILEKVSAYGFDVGFDIYSGTAQINGCLARDNVTGFRIRSTSTTMQNCYAYGNTTGYLFVNCVYTALIALAADNQTTAYKFDTGTTGPFTFQSPSSIVDMLDCGAEVASTYLYVDGNWSITCSNPTLDRVARGVYIESARNVIFRNLSFMRPRVNWLYVNTAKCPPDTVVVEGELPPQDVTVPPAPAYSNVPVAMSSFKTQVGVIGLAKTRLPPMDIIIGTNAANGSGSYLYKGKFTAQIGPANSLQFVVANGTNGFRSGGSANLVFYTNNAPAPTTRGGTIYMQTQNVSGISHAITSTTADVTVASSQTTISGVTYTYFTISRAAGNVWAYVDVETFTNFEPFQSDMFTIYNVWQATQL